MDVIFQLVTVLGQVWLSPYPKVYLEKQNPILMSGVSQFFLFFVQLTPCDVNTVCQTSQMDEITSKTRFS
jgi:hypothetical protein